MQEVHLEEVHLDNLEHSEEVHQKEDRLAVHHEEVRLEVHRREQEATLPPTRYLETTESVED